MPKGRAFWRALAPVEAYLALFGLLMATGGFLWLALGPTAAARAAGVVRRNGGGISTKKLVIEVVGHAGNSN